MSQFMQQIFKLQLLFGLGLPLLLQITMKPEKTAFPKQLPKQLLSLALQYIAFQSFKVHTSLHNITSYSLGYKKNVFSMLYCCFSDSADNGNGITAAQTPDGVGCVQSQVPL